MRQQVDHKGYWHDAAIADKLKDDMDRDRKDANPRYVIAFDIGSTVEIETSKGEKMLCVFKGAEKNKVTLDPIDEAGKPRPYLDVADSVTLSDGSNPGVRAQVWDNRNGKIVLRTMPVERVF